MGRRQRREERHLASTMRPSGIRTKTFFSWMHPVFRNPPKGLWSGKSKEMNLKRSRGSLA